MIQINKDDMTEVANALRLEERTVDNQNTILFGENTGFLHVHWKNKDDHLELKEDEIYELTNMLERWIEEQHYQIKHLRALVHASWWWRGCRQKKITRLERAVVGPERVLARLKTAR